MNIFQFNFRRSHLAAAATLFVSAALAFGYVLSITSELPTREELKTRLDPRNTAQATEIYDRNGIKIGEFASEKRYYIPIEKIPVHVRRAFIAIEDKSFYRHSGISPLAIVRAAISNLRGKNLQGASTITQQVARLHFLDQQKTVRRKIKEILLATMIERSFSKNQILEIYLNKVFLGNNSYGVESAARNYFRKSVKQLNIAEAAIIAGLPKAPSRLAPNRNLAAARQRARLVMKRMQEDGYLSNGAVAKWQKAAVQVAKGPLPQNSDTAFFINEIRKDLARKFEASDISLRGLKIVTTLDSRLQTAAADAVKANLQRKDFGVTSGSGANSGAEQGSDIQSALITIDPKNGDVLAMQGSSDFRKSQFNRVISTKRSIGSAHLPFLAATVLKQGYGMQSFPNLMDIVLNDMTYESGTILEAIGIGTYADFSKSVGIPVKQRNMSLALGVNQVTPMQLASAYGVFANDGVRVEPRLIHSVFGENGKVLYQAADRSKAAGTRVLPSQAVAAINNILQLKGQSSYPTPAENIAATGGVGGAFAATTSSSEQATDAWSIAYNPKAVTVVWMGSDHGRVKLANDQFMAANRVNSVWQNYWANIPREVKQSAALLADFPSHRDLGPGTRVSQANQKQTRPTGARRQ